MLSVSQLYVFKNIRFAAPPVGDLRWAKPAPPAQESGVQDGSYGPICVQTPLQGIPVPSSKEASEDCLFLDVYVPAKAIADPSLSLPVISWFYGGAYTFGGKDQVEPVLPLYDGTGLIQQSGGKCNLRGEQLSGECIFMLSNFGTFIP